MITLLKKSTGRRGAWLRGWTVAAMGAALAGPSFVHAQALNNAKLEVPPALSEALGWKALPKRGESRSYGELSSFAIGSEPAKWPAALEPSRLWLEQVPAADRAAAERVFRRLARIEALALGAADPKIAGQLRAERAALIEALQAAREVRGTEQDEWNRRNLLDTLKRSNRTLGEWLADSPADRVQLLRDAIAENQPVPREQIAKRYGGEERLARLIELGKEFNRLMAAQNDAHLLSSDERLQASAKATADMQAFYIKHSQDRGWDSIVHDPELAAELGGGGYNQPTLDVPANLLVWAGEAETARLLAEAYALRVQVNLPADSRTGVLARRLIVEGKIQPAAEPWSLVSWPEGEVTESSAEELVALHDALKARFNLAEKGNGYAWTRDGAKAAMAVALASKGRMDEAVALVKGSGGKISLPYRMRITPGMADAAWDLMLRLTDAAETENADRWDGLSQLAQAGNRRAELIAFAEKQAAAAKAGSAKAWMWRERQGWALVATGKIDEGLALVNASLDFGYAQRPSANEAPQWSAPVSKLLLLAKALNRPELATAWMERLDTEFKKPRSKAWDDQTLFERFAVAKLATGQGEELEAMLRARSTPKPKVKLPPLLALMSESSNDDYDSTDYRFATIWRADVLGRLGRHAEVLALFAESPNWGKPDVSGYITDSSGAGRALPLIAAESLHAVGRADEAIAILEAYLVENIGHDPAYALYLRIQGEKAAAFLEKLRAADRFEERPLIWLASVQLATGKVDEAERTVMQAIAIDPSDGEQPKNDRMRAYAVLREVALKKGDAKQAGFLGNVLAAIRRSENADDLAEAGLTDRAIDEYRLALESFSDAYCIQSRLARKLAEENRLDEAVEHYKRAFELMPDSFGRVESHCFGCERAFTGERAQGVAERVFTEMAAKPDAKPQVQYLLGYLRLEQERWDDAAAHFEKATVADPDYLNAWKKFAEVLPNTNRPRADYDRVAFRLLEMDPGGKRVGSYFAVRDLPKLWNHYAKAREVLPATPEKLFPLGDKAGKPASGESRSFTGDDENERIGTVQARFASHKAVAAITEGLDAAYQWHARQ